MRRRLSIFVLLGLMAATAGCSTGDAKKNAPTYKLPEAGTLHDNIQGFTARDISYALYLPKKFIPGGTTAGSGKGNTLKAGIRRWPVIVAFDPHGAGAIPVKKYMELADRYGFILIGSNNSKNGLPVNETWAIVSALITEVLAVYPVDTSSFCMAGFSGGSRVAAIAAMDFPIINAVIGCGAGLPGGTLPTVNRFSYFGIVGTGDFNMGEMLALEEPMTGAGIRHFITTFAGIHTWPPAEVMEEAIRWNLLNAMRDRTMPSSDSTVAAILEDMQKKVTVLKAANRLIAASDACREAAQFAAGLASAEWFSVELDRLRKLPAYKNQVDYRNAILKKESVEQAFLQESLASKDLPWWNHKVEMMGSKNMKGKNPEDTLMNSRLKAYLSLLCYSYANSAMAHHEPELASRIISVYEISDPPNPEPNYMKAVLLVGRSENEAALNQIKVAAGKGFSDKGRMMQQPEFEALKSSPAWFDLLKPMK